MRGVNCLVLLASLCVASRSMAAVQAPTATQVSFALPDPLPGDQVYGLSVHLTDNLGNAAVTDALTVRITSGTGMLVYSSFGTSLSDTEVRGAAGDGDVFDLWVAGLSGSITVCASLPSSVQDCETRTVVPPSGTGVQPILPLRITASTVTAVQFQTVDAANTAIHEQTSFNLGSSSFGCTLDTGSSTTDPQGLSAAHLVCREVGPAFVCAQSSSRTLCASTQVIAAGVDPGDVDGGSGDAGTVDGGGSGDSSSPALSVRLIDVPDAGIRPGTRLTALVNTRDMPILDADLLLTTSGAQTGSFCLVQGSACSDLVPDGETGRYGFPPGTAAAQLVWRGHSTGAVGAQGYIQVQLRSQGTPAAQDQVAFTVGPLRADLGCSSTGAALVPCWVSLVVLRVLRRRRSGA